ncbi:MAG: AAA family ATPase [Lachnospiraceae bacterium]|nr:AAA family ATPase [Lachnospiraceae bacterium]
MNIKQAKEYIKDCVKIYLKKDEFGEYRVPIVRQRPVFLLGAPGIGKTAIMEQIAQELGIALVSYSMTHHTRQSALGLPFICKKEYGGQTYDVSEYTMSEIIASVYETMEASGIREGILFLDEINCVSETLAPSMLQFLQYKVFGRHQVPEGWVVVTAGNPPEYNKSVREFDVVTLDRLKVLDVEADYRIWKEYAGEQGIHSAILNYLELKKEHFYRIEASMKGKTYVTARGWEDLSETLQLYEEEGMAVEEELIRQYIRNEKIAKEFAAYYDLYNKYKRDYRIDQILEGCAPKSAGARAAQAPFDERLSLVGMLLDKIQGEMREVIETADYLKELTVSLKAVKALLAKETGTDKKTDAAQTGGVLQRLLEEQIARREKKLEALQKAGSLSKADRRKEKRALAFLQAEAKRCLLGESGMDAISAGEEMPDGYAEAAETPAGGFAGIERRFKEQVAAMKRETSAVGKRLHFAFAFLEEVFPDGNEMLIFVTELTVNDYSARFIGMFGSEDYRRHNEKLMISERRNELQEEIAALSL